MKQILITFICLLTLSACDGRIVYESKLKSDKSDFTYNYKKYSKGKITISYGNVEFSVYADTVKFVEPYESTTLAIVGPELQSLINVKNNGEKITLKTRRPIYFIATKDSIDWLLDKDGEILISPDYEYNRIEFRDGLYQYTDKSGTTLYYYFLCNSGHTVAVHDIYGEEIIPAGKYSSIFPCVWEKVKEGNSFGEGRPVNKDILYYSVTDSHGGEGVCDNYGQEVLAPKDLWDSASPIYTYIDGQNILVGYFVRKGLKSGIVGCSGELLVPIIYGSHLSTGYDIRMEFGLDKAHPFWEATDENNRTALYSPTGKLIIPAGKYNYLELSVRTNNWLKNKGIEAEDFEWIQIDRSTDNGYKAKILDVDGNILCDWQSMEESMIVYIDESFYWYDPMTVTQGSKLKKYNPSATTYSYPPVLMGMGVNPQIIGNDFSSSSYESNTSNDYSSGISSRPRKCKWCGGDGKCGTCYGKGWYMAFGLEVTCGNCQHRGNGVCSFCQGSGLAN